MPQTGFRVGQASQDVLLSCSFVAVEYLNAQSLSADELYYRFACTAGKILPLPTTHPNRAIGKRNIHKQASLYPF